MQGMVESLLRNYQLTLAAYIWAYSKYVGAMSTVFQLSLEAQSLLKYYCW